MNLAIIFGGPGREHAISLLSAAEVYRHLPSYYAVYCIGVDKRGRYFLQTPSQDLKGFSLSYDKPLTLKTGGFFYQGNLLPVDLVFSLIHGDLGEDGKLQQKLEECGVAYMGSPPRAHHLGYDKYYFKRFCQNFGFPTIPSKFYTNDAKLLLTSKDSHPNPFPWDYPLVVKTNHGGSSLGIILVQGPQELQEAVEQAFQWDDSILVEPYLREKREIECAITGSHTQAVVHPLGEVVVEGLYDYHKKYEKNTPTRLLFEETSLLSKVTNMGKRLYQLAGCRDFARLDFLIQGENIYVSEMNTTPGFTAISLFPLMCQAGWQCSYPECLDRLIQVAWKREKTYL